MLTIEVLSSGDLLRELGLMAGQSQFPRPTRGLHGFVKSSRLCQGGGERVQQGGIGRLSG